MQPARANQQTAPGAALSRRQVGPDGRDIFEPSPSSIAIDDAYAAGRESLLMSVGMSHAQIDVVKQDASIDAARQRCDLHYDEDPTPIAVIGVGVTARVIRPVDLQPDPTRQAPRAGDGATVMLGGTAMAVMLVLGVLIGGGVVSMMWVMSSRGG